MHSWRITAVYVVASVAAGFLVPPIEHGYFERGAAALSIDSARAFLSAVASGMMALTGIVFSFAFVIIQFSGAAYSPRLVSWFARDPLIFHAMGVFIATFVYALVTLIWIERGGPGYVPLASSYIVLALLVASVMFLAKLLQRVGELQITNVLRMVGAEGRKAVEAIPLPPEFPKPTLTVPSQTIRYSGTPKVIAAVDTRRLVESAERAGAVLAFRCGVGDPVTFGDPMCSVYGSISTMSERTIAEGLLLRNERSPAHDPKYALRILVDIAIKALSPAVNDPTTAVQAVDQIEDLIYRIGQRCPQALYIAGAGGVACVLMPSPSWDDYLALAFDEIRICGSGQLQVMRRLRAALKDLAGAPFTRAQLDAVHKYLAHLDAVLDSSELDAFDRQTAHSADWQGIGLSR